MSAVTPTPARPSLLDLIRLPGTQRVPLTIVPVVPAAGAEWSQRVTGGVCWKVETVVATYTASAAVANRIPQIRITDGAATIYQRGQIGGVTAGVVANLCWARLCSASEAVAGSSTTAIFFPDLLLPGGSVISTVTIARDAGDQWSALALFVTEYRPPVDADWGALEAGAQVVG